jgi:hypothetical protein
LAGTSKEGAVRESSKQVYVINQQEDVLQEGQEEGGLLSEDPTGQQDQAFQAMKMT